MVSDGFFEALRVAPRQGRLFTPADGADAPRVAIVNETFARLHYPDGAIGRQVRTFAGTTTDWHTVVGVVPDIEEIDLGPTLIQGLYLPLAQRPSLSVNVVVRTQGDPLALAGTVRRIVTDLDRNLPIYNVTTVQKYLDDASWGWRIFGTLFSVFGIAALFLATVGLYGVMAFSVSRRTQEIGVRMAVGAGAADVLRMVLRQGAWQVGPGDVAGLGVAVALSNAMRLMFFQVSPFDSSPSWPSACSCSSPAWPRPSCRRDAPPGWIPWPRSAFSSAAWLGASG